MTNKEIFDILKECANFELKKYPDGSYHGYGSICHCDECKDMTPAYYYNYHYPEKSKKLESIPWTKVVKNPRNPEPDEYPTENGKYITMMDCNEHEIYTNTFRDGSFSWMNKTHIKWWIRIPENIEDSLKESIYGTR